MKKSTKILAVLTATILAGSFISCSKKGSNDSADKKSLTFSKSQGPYSVLFEEAVQPILEAKGYKIKGIDFSELALADEALNSGEVDFNVEQHKAYAENFNKSKGGDLVPISYIPTVPASLFSAKYKSHKDIFNGAKVAVPNDAANTARAYVLLQKAGWIKLRDGVNLATATNEDIVENPYNIKFTEMKSLTIPAVIDDFDFVVITGSVVYNAGIDASTALLNENVLPHLILQVVVKEKNKDTQWAKDLAEAYHSAELKKWLDENNKGLWWIPDGYFN